jgi:hypothetical protein
MGASVRAYIALVRILGEVRIAGSIIGCVVAGSGIAKITGTAPARPIIWVGSAITAPCPAGSPEIRDSTAIRPSRGLAQSETPANSALIKTGVAASKAALAESVCE